MRISLYPIILNFVSLLILKFDQIFQIGDMMKVIEIENP
jgi:small-conductance mechanosensitive channel